jgi:hypothetical protein
MTPAKTGKIIVGLIVAALAGAAFYASQPRPSAAQSAGQNQNETTKRTIPAADRVAGSNSTTNAEDSAAMEMSRRGDLYASFKQRPFPVAYESARVQWTLADGKDTNVIRELAHNPLEYERMVEENARIFKRQLVYLKEPSAAVFEQAKLTGKPVGQLTLPGVDGQELAFEIVTSDANASGRRGMFSGHLAGNPDSTVTLAFQDGREAFTILSPKDNIFVVGEPREPGQVIVKAIDPNTYGVGPAEGGDDAMNPTSK